MQHSPGLRRARLLGANRRLQFQGLGRLSPGSLLRLCWCQANSREKSHRAVRVVLEAWSTWELSRVQTQDRGHKFLMLWLEALGQEQDSWLGVPRKAEDSGLKEASTGRSPISLGG